MENRARRVPSTMARVSRQGLTLIQRLFEPSAAAGGKQRWFRMLLSAFLLLIAINTFIGMVVMKNAGNSLWVIMLATGAILTLGYVLSRTIYYRLATVIAVSIPAVPIIAMVLFSPNRDVIPHQLPWLALPLLACSLVLSLRRTVIIAICYAALIMLFIPLVKVPIADLTQTLAFMFMIIFFVVAVTAASQQGQAEIEHQFAERQAAETALRESEDKFSKAFHASPAIISISTLKEGRIIEVNDSFTQISGYTREEVIGHSKIELGMHTNPADREKIAQAMEKGGTIHNIEIELRKKSGETHCVLFSAEPVNIGGEPCILGVSTDITEQKRTEESLRKSDEKFSKAFRASPEMISITSLKDDRFIEVNDTFLHQAGLNRDEVIGHSADDIKIQLRDADHDRITQLMEKQGSVHNEEVKSVTKTGEERFMLFSAEVIEIGDEPCIIVLTNDITEQKRTEESLRKSEEQFRRSLDDSPMGIRIIDAEGDETVYANKAILDLYGYDSLKELKETPAEQRYTPQSYAEYRASREKRKRSSKDAPSRYELSIVRKDGEIRDLEAVVKEMLWDGKKHLQVIYNDITERKRAEMELVTAQEKLREAHRLAHIGTWDLVIETDKVTWSEELYRIVGWDPSRPTPPSSELQHLYTPDSWNRLNSATTKAYATGEPYELELEIIRPDGSTRWVNEFGGVMRDGNGDIIGFHGTLQDITERKAAEVALSFKNTLFDALLETTIDGIMVVDKNERMIINNTRFLEINRIPQEWLEAGEDARVLQQIASMVEDPEMLAEKINYLYAHKEERSRDKIRFKDGTICDRYSSPLIDAKGVYLGRIWFIRDITAQEQAEEAIMFKGTMLEALAEVTLDALLVVDENDKILLYNKRFQEMGNIPTELLEARDDTRVLSLFVSQMKNPKTFAKKVKYLYEHKEAKSYDEMSRKDGKVFDRYSSPMIDANGIYRGRVWFFRDITERRRSEEALRESEEKFSKAFRSSPDAIVISALKDGVFIEMNDSFTRFIGYTREELIGRSSTEFETWARPEDRARMLQVLKEKGRVSNEEYEFRRKSGEIRTWLFSAELIDIGDKPCLLSVNTDITEQRQMEAALRESEEKYRAIFEQGADSIVIIEEDPMRIVDFNDKAHENLGYTRKEFAKIELGKINATRSAEKVRHNIKEIHEKGILVFEEKQFTKTGEIRDVLISSKSINIGGRWLQMGIWHDISEQKQMEGNLKQTLFDLERSSTQLAITNKELETFSYSVSHDLRSPLRSIDGFSQALLEDYQDNLDDTGKDYLQRLRSASQKMGELIDGILKLSRLTRSEMHKEDINLSALVEEITSRLQENEPQRHANFVIKEGLVTQGDPQLLRALMENLIGNAWKFTRKRKEARIEFGTSKNGGKTTYYINDNGAGFDMIYADKLFGAFQRLHDVSEFPGTGIGLATVQRIINRHGGNIWAEGAVDKGATFYFTLN